MRRRLLLSIFVLMTGACDRLRDVACTAGEAGCPCAANDRCNGDALCDSGYCVPTACVRGEEGCGCAAAHACDLEDGVRMSCIGGICVARSLATVSCDDHTACPQDGSARVCVRGVCEIEGCPSGTPGCPCGPHGRCEPFEGRNVYCSPDGVCGPT